MTTKKTILIKYLHKTLKTYDTVKGEKSYIIGKVTPLITRNILKTETAIDKKIIELIEDFNERSEEIVGEMERRKASRIKGINTRTSETYIGQSKNIKRRFKRHIKELKANIHHNKGMQEDYNNGDEFVLEILEKTENSRKILHEREVIWIIKLNTFYEGYNQTPGGIYDNFAGRIGYGGGRLPYSKYETYLPKKNK